MCFLELIDHLRVEAQAAVTGSDHVRGIANVRFSGKSVDPVVLRIVVFIGFLPLYRLDFKIYYQPHFDQSRLQWSKTIKKRKG